MEFSSIANFNFPVWHLRENFPICFFKRVRKNSSRVTGLYVILILSRACLISFITTNGGFLEMLSNENGPLWTLISTESACQKKWDCFIGFKESTFSLLGVFLPRC